MRFETIAAAAALALAMPCGAWAQSSDNGHDYGTVAVGMLMPNKQGLTVGTTGVTAHYDTGYIIQGALGHDYDNGLRVEVELGYGSSSRKDITVGGNTRAAVGGHVEQTSVHAALYYDFSAFGVQPFVGAGVGATHSRIGTVTDPSAGLTIPPEHSTKASAFGELGISIPMLAYLTFAPAVRYAWINTRRTGADDTSAFIFRTAFKIAF